MFPGLPVDRADVLLGVIVSSKSRKHHHRHLQDTPSPATHIRAEVTLKRHHSTGDEGNSGELQKKRIKFQTEIGFGGQTPPSGSRRGVGLSFSTKKEPADDDESAPYSPSNLLDDVDALDSKSKSVSKPLAEEKTQSHEGVQVSFYGEHRPLSSVSSFSSQSLSSSDTSSKVAGTPSVEEINTSVMAASLKATLNLPPATDIKNILAQLSNDKLKELASAVSSLEKISEGGPALDPSLFPGKEVGSTDMETVVGNSSQEPTMTPSVPPVSLPSSVSNTPQQDVTLSDSTVTASSFDSVSTQMTNHSPTVAPPSQRYTINAQQDTDPPSQIIHTHQTQGSQPQLHQAQSSQPQLHQAQSSQPQVHQTQGSQPQVHQAQGSQPQLRQAQVPQPQPHQAQSSLPQVHDSQTHPVQYHPDSQQMQQSGDNADNFKWDHRQDHHPSYNPPSQSYNHYPQQSLEGQQGFQQQSNYQQQEYQPQQTPDLSHGSNNSNPNYPSQPMYSHTPHQTPPSQDDTAYQQQGQYVGHGWQDPHSAHQHSHWGHQEQQQYAREHMPYNESHYEDRGNNEGFRGFRGGRGYRGHGFRGRRRGRWLGDGRHMDHGDRYRGYHGRGRDM